MFTSDRIDAASTAVTHAANTTDVLDVRLFGKFLAQRGDQPLKGLDVSKVQELFSYLLIHRNRPHSRERLASLLWGDTQTAQSKKYLRHALWQLQSCLDASGLPSQQLLCVDNEWVRLDTQGDLFLDVAEFEQVAARVHGVASQDLDTTSAQRLRDAVQLYGGDLLEGSYQDWCLYERERLQNLYLAMLDKLMGYCELHHEYESGLAYGSSILRYDRARERTHRRLMRLYYLSGDRTAALRQFECCTHALEQELGVRPAQRTLILYEQLRTDRLDEAPVLSAVGDGLADVLMRLERLQEALTYLQRHVQESVRALECILKDRR